jgi:hypothetical protein
MWLAGIFGFVMAGLDPVIHVLLGLFGREKLCGYLFDGFRRVALFCNSRQSSPKLLHI